MTFIRHGHMDASDRQPGRSLQRMRLRRVCGKSYPGSWHAIAVSAELHPDPDGSLAIWLESGDYALLGSTELLTSGVPPYEVVALLRVPPDPAPAYAGELNMKTESHEGEHVSYSELGEISVSLLPIDIARVTLEQRLGTLPAAPVLSPWCAGGHLPGFNDSDLAVRASEILDRGCDGTPEY